MAVYVDPLTTVEPTAKWKWTQACHMFADSVDELDKLALSIGLFPEWRQNSNLGGFVHYDLTASKRKKAIAAGARQLDSRETGRFLINSMRSKR